MKNTNKIFFQQAMNFWYNLDNESQVNISTAINSFLENWKECHYFWMDELEDFIGFSLKMQLDMEQDYINFLINEKYNIKKIVKIAKQIYFHINPLEKKESCNRN